MFDYNFMEWIAFFYFYCMVGWMIESTYVSLNSRKIINRGFMRGPFLPLYGSGAIMMLVVSKPFHDNVLLVFLAGCIGASILEYVTGVLMEYFFKVRYWDYSHSRFQYKGHISLYTSLSWGALTVVMTKFIHSPIERALLNIPSSILYVIVFVVTVIMVVDFSRSVKNALDIKDILHKMDKAREELERVQMRLDYILKTAVEKKDVIVEEIKGDIKEEIEELKEKINVHKANGVLLKSLINTYKKSMIKGNPSMISRKFKKGLEEIKEMVKEKANKK